jgi:hypothetical protein
VLCPTPVAFGIGRLASVRRSSSVSRFRSFCPYARVAGAGTLPGIVILAGNYTSKTPKTIARGTGEAILLTGATGFVGMAVLARRLERTDHDVLVLVRAASRSQADARLNAVLGSVFDAPERHRRRVRAVCGNLTAPGLGLGADREWIAEEVHEVVSCVRVSSSASAGRAGQARLTWSTVRCARSRAERIPSSRADATQCLTSSPSITSPTRFSRSQPRRQRPAGRFTSSPASKQRPSVSLHISRRGALAGARLGSYRQASTDPPSTR